MQKYMQFKLVKIKNTRNQTLVFSFCQNKKFSFENLIFKVVSWWRFELQTDRLEGDCSIQLSYQDISQYRLYNNIKKIATIF